MPRPAKPAATVRSAFVTTLYEAMVAQADAINDDLLAACFSIAEDDEAGQRWCEEKGYAGYTSYASLNDLAWRDPTFKALADALDAHAHAFADAAVLDLGGRALTLDSLWINILDPGGMHSGHIHPHSVISGTYYVAIPEGASALRFEDPRLPLMMAAPPRREDADQDRQTFVSVSPRPGMVLLWESWLRHEVLMNQADEPRVSISFNYRWG